MLRRPPRSTRTDTLFPYTTLFRSIAKLVQIVGPMLHHADALIPIFASRVDTAGRLGIEMGELPLDRLRVPHAHLVEERGCCRSEPMRRSEGRRVGKECVRTVRCQGSRQQ